MASSGGRAEQGPIAAHAVPWPWEREMRKRRRGPRGAGVHGRLRLGRGSKLSDSISLPMPCSAGQGESGLGDVTGRRVLDGLLSRSVCLGSCMGQGQWSTASGPSKTGLKVHSGTSAVSASVACRAVQHSAAQHRCMSMLAKLVPDIDTPLHRQGPALPAMPCHAHLGPWDNGRNGELLEPPYTHTQHTLGTRRNGVRRHSL